MAVRKHPSHTSPDDDPLSACLAFAPARLCACVREWPGAGARQARRNHEPDNTGNDNDTSPRAPAGLRVEFDRRAGDAAGLHLEALETRAVTAGRRPGSATGGRRVAIMRLRRMRLREPTMAFVAAKPFRGDASGDDLTGPRKQAHGSRDCSSFAGHASTRCLTRGHTRAGRQRLACI